MACEGPVVWVMVELLGRTDTLACPARYPQSPRGEARVPVLLEPVAGDPLPSLASKGRSSFCLRADSVTVFSPIQEDAMKDKVLNCAVLIALVIVASVEGQRFLSATAAAQAPAARAGGLPMFQVDPSWPKVPAKWKLGDASRIGIDAQDHVWVLHRPRTLPADQAAMAAPPVMVFDGAGNFIHAWGGPGSSYEWPEREHGIRIDYKGFVWIGGNNCPARGLPGLKPVGDDQLLKFTQTGKYIMQIGHSSESTGNADTKNMHQPPDAVVYRKTK